MMPHKTWHFCTYRVPATHEFVHLSINGAVDGHENEVVSCTCSISPVSPLSEESSGKASRPWEGAHFGATPSAAPAPETPPLQASPDLLPPPGLGK
jgi:hypothetical protein